MKELGEQVRGDTERFAGEVAKVVGDGDAPAEGPTSAPASQPKTAARAEAELPAAADIFLDLVEIEKHTVLSRQLTRGEVTIAEIGLANIAQYLPTITGVGRDDALGTVRDLVNKDVKSKDKQQDSDVIAMLWDKHGTDAGVLNNLALEYLAQSTDRVEEAIGSRESKYASDDVAARVLEIERWIGVDKAKAFSALSAALGTDAAAVDLKLAELGLAGVSEDEEIFVYLAMQGEHRYNAVRDMDWKHDLTLLRALIRDDEQAREIVLAEIDEVGAVEQVVLWIRQLVGDVDEAGVVTEEGINYHKLATKPDLIQKALTAKDWTESPESAAQLMAINPIEARALAASDSKAAKQALWEAHEPYMVWIYLGAIGLGGTIGMIIFYFATRKALNAEAEARAVA